MNQMNETPGHQKKPKIETIDQLPRIDFLQTQPTTVAGLNEVLTKYKVTDPWTSEAKSEFIEELVEGAKRLGIYQEDGQTKLCMTQEVLLIDVRMKTTDGRELRLTETSQVRFMPDSDEGEDRTEKHRNLPYSVSEKIDIRDRTDDSGIYDANRPLDTQAAARRAMREEVKLEPNQYHLNSEPIRYERRNSSSSYPGIPSFDTAIPFKVWVDPNNQAILEDIVETEPQPYTNRRGEKAVGKKVTTRQWQLSEAQTPPNAIESGPLSTSFVIKNRHTTYESNIQTDAIEALPQTQEKIDLPESVTNLCLTIQRLGGRAVVSGQSLQEALHHQKRVQSKKYVLKVAGKDLYQLKQTLSEAGLEVKDVAPDLLQVVSSDGLVFDLYQTDRVSQPDQNCLTWESAFYDPLTETSYFPGTSKQDIETGIVDILDRKAFVKQPKNLAQAFKLMQQFGFSKASARFETAIMEMMQSISTNMLLPETDVTDQETRIELINSLLSSCDDYQVGLEFLGRTGLLSWAQENQVVRRIQPIDPELEQKAQQIGLGRTERRIARQPQYRKQDIA